MDPRRQTGYALVTVMVFFGISMMVLGGAMVWVSTSSRLTDRSNRYQEALLAAEAATEKVMGRMMYDFKNSGEAAVYGNLTAYRSAIPTLQENSGWSRFSFNNAAGVDNQIYVTRQQTAQYMPLDSQYAGLFGYASKYTIVANAKNIGSLDNVVGAVQQDIQLATIPLFQFAIFYNDYLDLNPGEDMEVRGRVHSNSDIWTGPNGKLTFYGSVTSSGRNTRTRHPKDPGYSSTLNNNVTYASGSTKSTNVSSLILPIGTNNTSDAVWEVLGMPPAGENIASPMGRERFYNKAEMLILVSNTSVNVKIKTPYGTPSTNLPWAMVSSFISTNTSFTDARESKKMKVTQIDVAKFNAFAATNNTIASVLGSGVTPSVLYIADNRTTTSTELTAVRLINGQTLPNRGLTVATPNPLYTKGNYNCPNSSHLNTTNTSQTKPAALISDALTVLSANWDDTKSTSSYTTRIATNTTVNAAILTGNVPWKTGMSSYYSGGAHNLTRYLEKWSGKTITYNTSLVCMFASKKATGQFQQSGGYYDIPTRETYFDNNFTDPTKLPPGTPQIRGMIRGKWQNPAPNTILASN